MFSRPSGSERQSRAPIVRNLSDIVSDKGFWTDLGSMDNQTTFIGKRQLDRGKGCVPQGGLWTIQTTKSNMREGLSHTIGAPDIVGKVFQFICQTVIDGTSTNDQVTDLL